MTERGQTRIVRPAPEVYWEGDDGEQEKPYQDGRYNPSPRPSDSFDVMRSHGNAAVGKDEMHEELRPSFGTANGSDRQIGYAESSHSIAPLTVPVREAEDPDDSPPRL